MFSSADWLTGSVIPFWSLEAFKLSMSCCARGSLVCSDGWRSDPVAWKCILGSLKKRRPVVGFQNGSSNRGFGSEKTTGMGGGVPRLTRSVSCWRWRSWPGGSERRAKEWEVWARRMNFEVSQSVEEPRCLGGVLPGEDSTSWSWFCPCYGWEEVFISYKEAVAPNRRRYLVRHGDTSFFRRPNCVPVL